MEQRILYQVSHEGESIHTIAITKEQERLLKWLLENDAIYEEMRFNKIEETPTVI